MIIGLDVGGTHTDVVLIGKSCGLKKEVKVPTDHSDLFGTVLTGFDRITADIAWDKIDRIVLSTTLTTNAIVQGKLPEVGMVVSGGPGIDPEFFRTNDHYFSVAGSMDHRGREISPVDREEIKKIAKKFRQAGIRHVGAVGKFSVRNPAHELQIGEILNDFFEQVFLGHKVSGHLNFPRRIATTYLNASVYPLHREFFEAVKKSLEQKGLSIPIHILKADGGTMNFESSIDSPGQTILSGPAASIMGAIVSAPANKEAVVLDIGGTTTDMAILLDRVPLLNPVGISLGGYKTLIRSLETRSLGIGGDSLVKIIDGKLVVGPERSGPAMAYGGSNPTPTDALFVLKKINGDRKNSLNGLMPIANDLGMTVEDTSLKILDYTCNKILLEIKEMIKHVNGKPVYTIHELKEGYTVNPESILVLGGPAPFFAKRLGELSHYKISIVPEWGVANAIGAALARTTCEVTLFADTEQGVVQAPEEGFSKTVNRQFSRKDALNIAFDLLKKKAVHKGADPEDFEIETIENLEFNMVRGFYTTGKNIRIKVQVKPGLIAGYNP